jgi:P3 major capsid protein
MATNPPTTQAPGASAKGQTMSPAQVNMAARAAVLGSSIRMTQKVFSSTFVPSSAGNVLNIVPRNVGMILGFYVKVSASISISGGSAVGVATPFGPANILSQIVFTDLNNYTRINTAGWHLHTVNTAKAHHPWASTYNTNSFPVGWGNNFAVISAAAPTGGGAATAMNMWYYVPLAYHSRDLRGAVYANVINATMNLQLTINANPVSAAAADPTLAVWAGGAAATGGTVTAATVTVYQDFLDQLPIGKNGVILPLQDLSTIYELKNTAVVGLTTGLDFPIPYTNFRSFLSTSAIFDNFGATVATPGADINYWALQSANFTNIFQIEPQLVQLLMRQKFFDDGPLGSANNIGTYYFDHRNKPINTVQYGNMELILNGAGVLATSPVVLLGYEDMGLQNTIIPAGSLPGG